MSARTSASRAPTARASASACSQIGKDSAWRQATHNPPASDASEYARSGEGGSAGTSSTARSTAARQASSLPVCSRYSPRRTWRRAARCGSLFTDELDRLAAQLDRAQGGTDFAGELGRPGAELGEIHV